MPSLLALPSELIADIALAVLDDAPLGPPAALIPLLATCRTLYHILARPIFAAAVFEARFDITAAARRHFHQRPPPTALARQLPLHCDTLHDILAGDIYDPDITSIFWHAFLMLTDDDGKNRAQLEWAGLPAFVDRFVRVRLWEDRIDGWPAENDANALALWIMWMMTTEERLRAETSEQRQEMCQLLLPFVITAMRYPVAYAPPHHFTVPLPSGIDHPDDPFPTSLVTAHGPYPLYLDPDALATTVRSHFTRLELARPFAATAAHLLYSARREIIPFGIPPHLPRDRATAIATGRTDIGPTQADVIEFNAHPDTRLPAVPPWDWARDLSAAELAAEEDGRVLLGASRAPSARWDVDRTRWEGCIDARDHAEEHGPCYVPGTLTGLWQGRMLIPNEVPYRELVSTTEFPDGFSEAHFYLTTVPLYMRLAEHHAVSPTVPAPAGDGEDDAPRTAWFPPGTRVAPEDVHGRAGVVVHAPGGPPRGTPYETWAHGAASSHDAATCHVCAARAEEADVRARARAREAARVPDEYVHLFAAAGLGRADDAMDVDTDADEGDGDGAYRPAVRRVGREDTVCDGVADIVFTGGTDAAHGAAWNHFAYHGRVRAWDGLVGLLRVARDARLGNLFFTGYVVGGANFVGRWRVAGAGAGGPAWEGAFTMSKRADE